MVVHISGNGYRDDGQRPLWNVPLGPHWVYFDVDRWQASQEYRDKILSMYRSGQAPAFLYDGRTQYDLDLDQLSDDGTLVKILQVGGVVGDHSDWFRHLIVSNTSQTGDVPHIAAAMARDPLTDVLIICSAGEDAIMNDMVATYTNAIRRYPALDKKNLCTSLGAGGRIKTLQQDPAAKYRWYPALIPDDNSYGPLGPPSWRSKDPADQDIYTYTRGDGIRAEYKMMYVGGATLLVAIKYGALGPATFFAQNAVDLASDDVRSDPAIAFMKSEYGLDLDAGGNYLIIWSRYSGKTKGYNPAGDSSITGNQQLVELAAKLGRIPVTIGHDPADGKQTPRGKIHLGEFWSNSSTKNPFLGKGRPGQANFYRLFHEKCDVIQVGQKTGGMDNAALVGMRTVYIEDVDSPQRWRMVKWSDVMPHYRGALVSRPPKRLGQSIRAISGMMGEPVATHNTGDEYTSAREWRDHYQKGYAPEDLSLIEKEISALPPK